VIDDDDLFRQGLVVLLERHGIRVVAKTGVVTDGIRDAARLAPDVVLVDVGMTATSSEGTIQRLAAAAPLTPVLVITDVAEDREVLAVLRAGASGYLLKTASIDQIIEGVHAASRGECSISPSIASRLVDQLRMPNGIRLPGPCTNLTPREREVLMLVALGADNRRIAKTLCLSQHTVNSYVSHILVKLRVENRIQAAVLAVREGLI
jgi:DNA-binding NarL/FixJ family response regulator